MAELDFSERNITDFVETESVTDYVKLNVSYTAEDGSEKSEDIVLRLFSNVAPISVSNFQNYVKNGFYDGLVFHRIIENFMIQGGGYDASLKSKESDAPIKGEFSANGVENNLEHVRGVLSMARTDDMNSATSEFFIVHKTSSHLDGKYAGFGFVVYGMDTVDAIATQETNSNDQPMNTVTINSATFVKEK
ncbi:MAG: peptidylprolyl isomerase [Clostridia bacterium]|nr:peptidylprolyl isomerase [Clostridia bacterium]